MEIKICVGSSCHLRGSEELVELFQKKIEEYSLQNEIELVGSFCAEKCNRVGVTLTVDGEVVTGVTLEGFENFFSEKVMPRIGKGV